MSLLKYQNEVWNDPIWDFENTVRQLMQERGPWNLFQPARNGQSRGGFRIDTFADDNNYYVVAELPGVEKKEIDIHLHNAVLTISGKRTYGEEDNARTVEFSRAVTVGDDVAPEKVTAKFEHGMLTITLPKPEERKPKAISIA